MVNRTRVVNANAATFGAANIIEGIKEQVAATTGGQGVGVNAGGQVLNNPALPNPIQATAGVATYIATYHTGQLPTTATG